MPPTLNHSHLTLNTWYFCEKKDIIFKIRSKNFFFFNIEVVCDKKHSRLVKAAHEIDYLINIGVTLYPNPKTLEVLYG
jgi:hypothetical protein